MSRHGWAAIKGRAEYGNRSNSETLPFIGRRSGFRLPIFRHYAT
jgi:hypothetical protein